MILAVDIGNTTIEMGIYNGKDLTGPFRIGTNLDITSDEIWLYTAQFFERKHIPVDYITDVIISSVVPQINYTVASAFKKHYKINPHIIGEDIPVNMKSNYDDEKSLGIDRLVDAYAAFGKMKTAVIVVDFGTATTVDAVSAKGEFVGGMIFPGIKTSIDALYEKAAKIPKVEIIKPSSEYGTNTVECMQMGAYYGYLGAVEKMIYKMKSVVGMEARVIATGGFSKLFEKEKIFDYIVPTLQLEGVRMLFEKACNYYV